MIDLTINSDRLARAVQRAKERNIIIPTLKQQQKPKLIPAAIAAKLKNVGLWDLNPLNLFRITWHNEPTPSGGGFGGVNFVEFPKALTGVEARILAPVGKWFPTGAHKVGAAFGCLVPRLVTGQFDPTTQKAVWPSTGNYCRGGAYDSALLACQSIAILPEGMSQERFNWLASVAGEIIKTPGSESNVKEIFDKCWELRNSGQDLMIFNQFEEFGNYLWHYEVTGAAMLEVLEQQMGPKDNYRGFISATGSAGTIATGDRLKKHFPTSKIVASEALQCPTLLNNGFGAHRIEGIGDKHVPWIHNVKNTDMVVAIDDEATVSLIRLFNESAGKKYLAGRGVSEELIARLPWLGISGVGNLLSAIKFAKYYELGENDVVLTVLTDSMEMYGSRLQELTQERGDFSELDAAAAYHQYLMGVTIDYVQELTYYERKRIHNLKYYTWVEQQGKTYEEIQAQWYDPTYWSDIPGHAEQIDALIEEFNAQTGLLKG
ncbi:MAG: pyridoxal-5-phosphate-dependent protein subunit beta [Anaerolineae bacterium]|nr:pyridoxal-phosphate dependent enzyme [Anaerolineales bacterium]MCQ3977209.1 pyridoxal-5-phosphate-dependent protein subunit beta [Anaerolineae bacterium]